MTYKLPGQTTHGVKSVGSKEEETFGLNSSPRAITKLLKRSAETEKKIYYTD